MGVELGQLLALGLITPLVGWLFRYVVAERMGTIILSALVAHTGWHWMIERAEVLRRFHFAWPDLAGAMRWVVLILILAGLDWIVVRLRRRV